MSKPVRSISLSLALLAIGASVVCPSLRARNLNRDSPKDTAEINAKIRAEEQDHSRIMRTLHVLTDIYGPRLTGSPSLKAADEWAIGELQGWGFQNAHLEAWNFGHPGWSNDRLSAHLLSPGKAELNCEALAWTPGTNGPVTAQVYQMRIPDKPTRESLTAYLDTVRDRVNGKIVFVGKPRFVPVTIEPRPRRMDDKRLHELFDPSDQKAPPAASQPQPPGPQASAIKVLNAGQVDQILNPWLIANHALVRVNDAGRAHGVIVAFNNPTFDISRMLPTLIMRNEDYGRISRILADGVSVELEINIVNRTYPDGDTAYNAIAELPGTDKKDEVIMLGAHLDSWHSATGATDNAIGCAVMMEAARLLQAIGVKPRRTIRLALWSGEEQGMLGSQAYVKDHFGSAENPRPDFHKFGGYFNIDAGTGRIRAANVFGPEAATVLRQALAPFADLGVIGAKEYSSRELGGSDNTSFSHAGLPAIGFAQDPIEYGPYTWHTNLDTYERIIEDDVRKSAIDIAATVYQLAMRDELLPRFNASEMPPISAQAAVRKRNTGRGIATK